MFCKVEKSVYVLVINTEHFSIISCLMRQYRSKFYSTTSTSIFVFKVKRGNYCGPDGSCAEALNVAHRKVYVLLSLCFSLCMTHGYIPQPLFETTLVPII